MIGLVKLGPGSDSVQLAEVPEPTPTPGYVVVSVTATGVCGTDLHIMADEYRSRLPVVMGHEITGRVTEVGSSLDDHWLGRRVAIETFFRTCERCDMCRSGRRNLCRDRESLGSWHHGGFAPRVLCPVTSLHEIPAGVSDHAAALAEPLACIAQSVLRSKPILPGQDVLVTGPGPMGFLAAQVARASGARVVVSGMPSDSGRLQIIANAGIETTTDAPPSDSFDSVFECAGAGAAAAAALSAARPGGGYVAVGIFGRDVSIPFDLLLTKELTLTSGFASTPASWRLAMGLIASGVLDLDAVVTDVYPLQDWRTAFDRLRAGDGMKVLITPDLR